MRRRYHQTAADYAVIAICPALIILMLTALVHFLVLCLYRGDFPARLMYILFLFIVAATLIARIAIEQGRGYAFGYALALGAATFFVLGPFSVLWLALIWWLADRITFDCTVIDDADRASGEGLVSAGGLFGGAGSFGARRGAPATRSDVALDGTTSTTAPRLDAKGGTTDEDSRALPRKRRGHKPGRWVLYLAFAALPLFGLGQLLLPDIDSVRNAALRSLGLYLFATLTLLVTTSFLGLRRYLRQRGTEMPGEVSVAWLGGGALLVAAVLLVGYLIPLPGRMIAAVDVPKWVTSLDRLDPSRFGWGDEGAGPPRQDGTAAGNEESSESQPDQTGEPNEAASSDEASNQQGQPSGQQSDDREQSSGEQSRGEQSSGEQSSGEQSRGEQSRGEQSPGEQSRGEQSGGEQSGGEQSGSEQSGGEQSGGEQSGGEQSGGEQSGGEQNRGERAAEREEQTQPLESDNAAASERQSDRATAANQSQSPEASPSVPSLPPIGAAIARMLKLVVVAVLLAVIVIFLVKNRHLIREWWEGLLAFFRGDRDSGAAMESAAAAVPTKPVRPFASFRNPMADGSDPAAAVIVSFQALEAWGRERGMARGEEETPTEYLRRARQLLGDAAPAGERLADAYNRIVYGRGKPTRGDLAAVERTWRTMTAGH